MIYITEITGNNNTEVNINNLSVENLTIGVNTWNPIGFSTSWTTTSAGMGGNLINPNYEFRLSNDMLNIATFNAESNAIWNGSHNISKDGGKTWNPCISESFDMNGGISVSSDGCIWIATRTSTETDGGIYRSINGINFDQVLSVQMTGSTFKCCEISLNGLAILVCTDSPRTSPNYNVPFFISLDGGDTWKSVIPSACHDHHSISDSSISNDGKYMVALDKNGVFISSDYGNTWSLRGITGRSDRRITMSKDGRHIYLSSLNYPFFSYSTDFGMTWNINGYLSGYSGVSCDDTGRYVYLSGDLSCPYFWFSNNYGMSFIKLIVQSVTNTINTNSDGSSVMTYDGNTKLRFNTMTDHSIHTGTVTVNGTMNCESITGKNVFFTEITGFSAYFDNTTIRSITGSSEFLETLIVSGTSVFGEITGTSAFLRITGTSAFFEKITGTSAFFEKITGTSAFFGEITGTSAFFGEITGTSAFFEKNHWNISFFERDHWNISFFWRNHWN